MLLRVAHGTIGVAGPLVGMPDERQKVARRWSDKAQGIVSKRTAQFASA